VIAVVLASGLSVLAAPALAATKTVRITEASDRYHFTPSTITVAAGDSVTWKNMSDATHTVTSDTGSELGSSRIGAGKTYSHTFAAAGTFAYHCTIHDYMKGKVIVLAAGATLPATDSDAATTARKGSFLPLGLFLIGAFAFVVLLRMITDRRSER
jgi:plastocyanin